MEIDLDTLPPEGGQLTGAYDYDILDLPPKDLTRPDGSVEYDVYVHQTGGTVVATGTFCAPVLLQCTSCERRFRQVIELTDHSVSEEVAGDSMINLTDMVREDILLALPSYPRCDESLVEKYDCTGDSAIDEVNERAAAEDNGDGPSATDSGSGEGASGGGVWDALDDLSKN